MSNRAKVVVVAGLVLTVLVVSLLVLLPFSAGNRGFARCGPPITEVFETFGLCKDEASGRIGAAMFAAVLIGGATAIAAWVMR